MGNYDEQAIEKLKQNVTDMYNYHLPFMTANKILSENESKVSHEYRKNIRDCLKKLFPDTYVPSMGGFAQVSYFFSFKVGETLTDDLKIFKQAMLATGIYKKATANKNQHGASVTFYTQK